MTILMIATIPAAEAKDINVHADGSMDAVSLDNALEIARNKDRIVLHSDINSTLTRDNRTMIRHSVNLQSNGYTIFLNNTVTCRGKAMGHPPMFLCFLDNPNFVYQHGNSAFHNASLIEILDNFVLIGNRADTVVSIDTRESTLDTLNVTGCDSTIMGFHLVIGNATPSNRCAIRLGGSHNRLEETSLDRLTAAEYGIMIDGYNNTATIRSDNIFAPYGKVFISPDAEENTIWDSSFEENPPFVSIYDGDTPRTTGAWYFFNSTWSPTHANTHLTINVSPAIPLAGNVGFAAEFGNVTGDPSDIQWNTVLTELDGYFGGVIRNVTDATRFVSPSADVPVSVTFGNNIFMGCRGYAGIGMVRVLSFEPIHSLPEKNLNATMTTKWVDIPDYTHVDNLTFAADSGVPDHRVLGCLSYNEPLDLTSPAVAAALPNLGASLDFAPGGNCFGMQDHPDMQAFRKPATPTVSPAGFGFASGKDISITAISDTGAESMIYNKGQWYGKAGHVADSQDITVGPGSIRMPVIVPSRYRFAPAWTSPFAVAQYTGGGSDSDGPAAAPAPHGNAVHAPPKPGGTTRTVSVNVGGDSAIIRAEITGVGVSDAIVTAVARAELPASVPKPTGPVYQVVDVSSGRAAEITGAVLTFSVPSSWLAGQGISSTDIALMVNEGKDWVPLATEIVGEKGGQATYRAQTRHLSYFAVVSRKGAATRAAVQVTTSPAAPAVSVSAVAAPSVAGTTKPGEKPAPRGTASPATTMPAPSGTAKAPGFGLVTGFVCKPAPAPPCAVERPRGGPRSWDRGEVPPRGVSTLPQIFILPAFLSPPTRRKKVLTRAIFSAPFHSRGWAVRTNGPDTRLQ
jgi:PGF-pre-PGF domain-containing protein